MIRIVCWNINRKLQPWRTLVEMAERGEADVALLQEAGSPPEDVSGRVEYDDHVFRDRNLYDRWPLIVRLSDRAEFEWLRQHEPISDLDERSIGVSGIGTIAGAKISPRDQPQNAFLAFSMYARWMRVHPTTGASWIYSDCSAHRILSDISTFIDHANPEKQKILAAGDMNMFFGATGNELSVPEREQTVWDRFSALGLEFLGPQLPHGRPAATKQPDVPTTTQNIPTFHTTKQSPAQANRQLDYAFASRGFHRSINVRALNKVEEWGPSDHCRLMIEVFGDNSRD